MDRWSRSRFTRPTPKRVAEEEHRPQATEEKIEEKGRDLGYAAARPAYSALGSVRGNQMPNLEQSVRTYVEATAAVLQQARLRRRYEAPGPQGIETEGVASGSSPGIAVPPDNGEDGSRGRQQCQHRS